MGYKRTGRPPGRPPGARSNPARDKFVHAVVHWLISDMSISARDAGNVAAFLLSGFTSEPPPGWIRRVLLGGATWGKARVDVSVPVSGSCASHETLHLPIALPILAQWGPVWGEWEGVVSTAGVELKGRGWFGMLAHTLGLPDKPIVLSPSGIMRIYAKEQQAINPTVRLVCSNCEHVNESKAGRGETIFCDDSCRKCGASLLGPIGGDN